MKMDWKNPNQQQFTWCENMRLLELQILLSIANAIKTMMREQSVMIECEPWTLLFEYVDTSNYRKIGIILHAPLHTM